MTPSVPRTLVFRAALLAGLTLAAAPAFAQDNGSAPRGLENFSLPPGNQVAPPVEQPQPQTQPTPVAPPPVRPTVPAPSPAPVPAPSPTPAPTSTPTRDTPTVPDRQPIDTAPVPDAPIGEALPTDPILNEALPPPVAAAPATIPDEVVADPVETGGGMGIWPYVALALAAAAGAAIFFVLRRRRRARDAAYWQDDKSIVFDRGDAPAPPPMPVPDPEPAPPPAAAASLAAAPPPAPPPPPVPEVRDPVALATEEAAPLDQAEADLAEPTAETSLVEPAPADVDALAAAAVPSTDRPWLEFALRPVKAGTNVVDAVVEFELTVGNAGEVAAEDVRIAAWLLSASPNQDADIARFLGDLPAEAVMAPIAIPPGDGKRVDAAIALPKTGLNVVHVRDRPFFVPMIVADARYRLPDGGEGRTSAAFVVGTVRPGVEKLGPIWLDRGPRMHDNVEARLHGKAARA